MGQDRVTGQSAVTGGRPRVRPVPSDRVSIDVLAQEFQVLGFTVIERVLPDAHCRRCWEFVAREIAKGPLEAVQQSFRGRGLGEGSRATRMTVSRGDAVLLDSQGERPVGATYSIVKQPGETLTLKEVVMERP